MLHVEARVDVKRALAVTSLEASCAHR